MSMPCHVPRARTRFASPNRRAFTIRFSSSAVLFQRPEDGLWCLSFRLANIRKHSLINPQARQRQHASLAPSFPERSPQPSACTSAVQLGRHSTVVPTPLQQRHSAHWKPFSTSSPCVLRRYCPSPTADLSHACAACGGPWSAHRCLRGRPTQHRQLGAFPLPGRSTFDGLWCAVGGMPQLRLVVVLG